ncbi:MAG: DUF302 domain-containing protein, partial [Gammaproteobacteria bacterium]
ALIACESQDRPAQKTSTVVGRPSMALIERSETSKSFDDVIFELDFAITERNYRITGRNTIGKGLRARGYEDFPDVEVIHFCNLEYAREVLILDPGFVAQMPCRITIHEESDKTVISLILLPEDHENEQVNEFSRRMNAILRDVVSFVIDPDK